MPCFTLSGNERFGPHQQTGETVPIHDLHARYYQLAADIEPQVIAWRHHIHRHPAHLEAEYGRSRIGRRLGLRTGGYQTHCKE